MIRVNPESISCHNLQEQAAFRCRIVLGVAEGEADSAISRRLSVNRNTVILWRKRFVESGLDGLWHVAPGRGRKPTYAIGKIAAIVDATLQTKPVGMTHWSCRTLAEQQGVGKSTVNNLWRAHNLQPHRTETFKLSRDPKFLEKMTDVVGLYLNPPQKAVEKVTAWLKRHPRFVPHFVPTSSSWMNLVERWFGHLDNKAIKRDIFLSVEDLQASIAAFLNAGNENPKPFVWTATVHSIQEKLTRCRRTLEQIQPGCTSPKTRKRKKTTV
jgi:Homeodomain-like domain/DDE superfamily endonuclease